MCATRCKVSDAGTLLPVGVVVVMCARIATAALRIMVVVLGSTVFCDAVYEPPRQLCKISLHYYPGEDDGKGEHELEIKIYAGVQKVYRRCGRRR